MATANDLGRTALQQAMSAARDPIQRTDGQRPGLHRRASPIHPLRGLNDRSLSRHGHKRGFFIGWCERSVEFSSKHPGPWHCKPGQRGRLKRKADTECSLVGGYRIVPVLRCPMAYDESNPVLHCECPCEVREVQSAVGARGDFYRKVVRDDRIAQDGGSPYDRYDGPGHDGRQRHSQNQG
jgi:hypothetical protein